VRQDHQQDAGQQRMQEMQIGEDHPMLSTTTSPPQSER
jgi:hypothetical protein